MYSSSIHGAKRSQQGATPASAARPRQRRVLATASSDDENSKENAHPHPSSIDRCKPAAANAQALDKLSSSFSALRDELTCAVCLELCMRPCTTPCGHNFCRSCLRTNLELNNPCPRCRGAIPPGWLLTINTTLWNTIQHLFPKDAESKPVTPLQQQQPQQRSRAAGAAGSDGWSQNAYAGQRGSNASVRRPFIAPRIAPRPAEHFYGQPGGVLGLASQAGRSVSGPRLRPGARPVDTNHDIISSDDDDLADVIPAGSVQASFAGQHMASVRVAPAAHARFIPPRQVAYSTNMQATAPAVLHNAAPMGPFARQHMAGGRAAVNEGAVGSGARQLPIQPLPVTSFPIMSTDTGCHWQASGEHSSTGRPGGAAAAHSGSQAPAGQRADMPRNVARRRRSRSAEPPIELESLLQGCNLGPSSSSQLQHRTTHNGAATSMHVFGPQDAGWGAENRKQDAIAQGGEGSSGQQGHWQHLSAYDSPAATPSGQATSLTAGAAYGGQQSNQQQQGRQPHPLDVLIGLHAPAQQGHTQAPAPDSALNPFLRQPKSQGPSTRKARGRVQTASQSLSQHAQPSAPTVGHVAVPVVLPLQMDATEQQQGQLPAQLLSQQSKQALGVLLATCPSAEALPRHVTAASMAVLHASRGALQHGTGSQRLAPALSGIGTHCSASGHTGSASSPDSYEEATAEPVASLADALDGLAYEAGLLDEEEEDTASALQVDSTQTHAPLLHGMWANPKAAPTAAMRPSMVQRQARSAYSSTPGHAVASAVAGSGAAAGRSSLATTAIPGRLAQQGAPLRRDTVHDQRAGQDAPLTALPAGAPVSSTGALQLTQQDTGHKGRDQGVLAAHTSAATDFTANAMSGSMASQGNGLAERWNTHTAARQPVQHGLDPGGLRLGGPAWQDTSNDAAGAYRNDVAFAGTGYVDTHDDSDDAHLLIVEGMDMLSPGPVGHAGPAAAVHAPWAQAPAARPVSWQPAQPVQCSVLHVQQGPLAAAFGGAREPGPVSVLACDQQTVTGLPWSTGTGGGTATPEWSDSESEEEGAVGVGAVSAVLQPSHNIRQVFSNAAASSASVLGAALQQVPTALVQSSKIDTQAGQPVPAKHTAALHAGAGVSGVHRAAPLKPLVTSSARMVRGPSGAPSSPINLLSSDDEW